MGTPTCEVGQIVKELDPTRPVTAGCIEPAPYTLHTRAGELDIIGYNYHESDYAKVPVNFSRKTVHS